jgi:hypothetical protein
MTTTTKTINTALSSLLSALGFAQMAKDVVKETEPERLSRYARVVIKNSPADKRIALVTLFSQAGLI